MSDRDLYLSVHSGIDTIDIRCPFFKRVRALQGAVPNKSETRLPEYTGNGRGSGDFLSVLRILRTVIGVSEMNLIIWSII